MKTFDPSKFTVAKAKPLPVILLLDVSGSMDEVVVGDFTRTGQFVEEDGQSWELVKGGRTRIQIMNQAVQNMLRVLANQEQLGHEIQVAVITFGGTAQLHLPLTTTSEVSWVELKASGQTPLGAAIKMAKTMIEDKGTVPSRAYRPVVVLVSDGRPTDAWEKHLDGFVQAGRSSKCDRMAMAIGTGAHEEMLERFILGTENPLFRAGDEERIHEFFKRVTMSVTVRSRSMDPNRIPVVRDVDPASQEYKDIIEAARLDVASDEDDGYW